MKKEIPTYAILIAAAVLLVLYFVYTNQQKQNYLLTQQNVMLGSALKLLADKPQTTPSLNASESRTRIGFQLPKSAE